MMKQRLRQYDFFKKLQQIVRPRPTCPTSELFSHLMGSYEKVGQSITLVQTIQDLDKSLKLRWSRVRQHAAPFWFSSMNFILFDQAYITHRNRQWILFWLPDQFDLLGLNKESFKSPFT